MPAPHNPHTPIERADAAIGYEPRDVKPQVVIYLAAAVSLLVVGSMIGLWRLADLRREDAGRRDTTQKGTELPPPSPRLQSAPARDYLEYQAAQEAELNSYGWVDKGRGLVRIPIDRAMELALERGLPQPQPANPPPSEEEAK